MHTRAASERTHGSRAGFTALEILVTMSVLLVAASIFYRTLIATKRLREINFERSIAADQVRVVLEEMHGQPFIELYARYNEDPTDDPDGDGTAPGNRFTVPGLTEVAPPTPVGEIILPAQWVDVEVETSSGGLLGKLAGVSTTTTVTQLHLREDAVDPELGMPRDLNGDFHVDALDHANDYLLLPVRIVVTWQGQHGVRTFSMATVLTDYAR